jgi:hypothetical protein
VVYLPVLGAVSVLGTLLAAGAHCWMSGAGVTYTSVLRDVAPFCIVVSMAVGTEALHTKLTHAASRGIIHCPKPDGSEAMDLIACRHTNSFVYGDRFGGVIGQGRELFIISPSRDRAYSLTRPSWPYWRRLRTLLKKFSEYLGRIL